MKSFTSQFRVVPVVVFGIASLLVLKMTGLLAEGSYVLGGPRSAQAQATSSTKGDQRPIVVAQNKRSWAQEMFGYPEVTGSVGAKPAEKPPAKPEEPAKGQAKEADATKPPATQIAPEPARTTVSPGERAILERLQERRQEIEARARELEIREGLIKAAEKRIEVRINELKELEGRIIAATHKKEEADAARFKGLVTMYENMKAKDAAKIFDRLDVKLLVELTPLMNPRRMSDIMALMIPEAAERLTVELANRNAQSEKAPPAAHQLPKIEGKPNGS